MHIPTTCLAALAVTATLASTASALPVYEGFDYTVGNQVIGSSGGVGFSGPWYNVLGSPGEITAGSLVDPTATLLTTGNTGTEIDEGRLYRNLDTIIPDDLPVPDDVPTQGDLYLSVLMQASSDQAYFGFELFRNGNNDPNRTLQIANEGGVFQLRLNNNNATSAPLPAPGTDTHLYVLRFDFDDLLTEVTAYVDPDPTQPEPVGSGVTVGTNTFSFDRVAFAIFQGGMGEQRLNVDELRIGDTFESVTPVPEPALVGVLSVVGVGLLRRRRP